MIKDDARDEWRELVRERVRVALHDVGYGSHNTARAIAADLTKMSGEELKHDHIYGWIKTGRVAKRWLTHLAEYTGRPLEFFTPPLPNARSAEMVDRPKENRMELDAETKALATIFSRMPPAARANVYNALAGVQAQVAKEELAPAIEALVKQLQGLTPGELEQVTRVVSGVISALSPARPASKAYERAKAALAA